jgi:ABC-type transport system substrate-binding protein
MRFTQSFKLSVFLVLPLFFTLTGCAKHVSHDAPVGNTFRYALNVEPTTFDPVEIEDVPTGDLLQNVYEGLVEWTPKNTLAPAIAESWSVSKDGRTYTFKIRPGVKFHSGKVVTAADVVYSLSRGFQPRLASPVALTYLGDIVGAADVASGKTTILAGVKEIDPSTVAITITKPKAYWVNVLTYPTAFIVNQDAVSKNPDGKVTELNEDGTGPFVLTSYMRGQSVTLKAFTGYLAGAPSSTWSICRPAWSATMKLIRFFQSRFSSFLSRPPNIFT